MPEPLRYTEIPEVTAVTVDQINQVIRQLNTQLDELVRRLSAIEARGAPR